MTRLHVNHIGQYSEGSIKNINGTYAERDINYYSKDNDTAKQLAFDEAKLDIEQQLLPMKLKAMAFLILGTFPLLGYAGYSLFQNLSSSPFGSSKQPPPSIFESFLPLIIMFIGFIIINVLVAIFTHKIKKNRFALWKAAWQKIEEVTGRSEWQP